MGKVSVMTDTDEELERRRMETLATIQRLHDNLELIETEQLRRKSFGYSTNPR